MESPLCQRLTHLPTQMWRRAKRAPSLFSFSLQTQLKPHKHGLLFNRSCTWEMVRHSFDFFWLFLIAESNLTCWIVICRLLTDGMFVVRRRCQTRQPQDNQAKALLRTRLHRSSLASLVVWLVWHRKYLWLRPRNLWSHLRGQRSVDSCFSLSLSLSVSYYPFHSPVPQFLFFFVHLSIFITQKHNCWSRGIIGTSAKTAEFQKTRGISQTDSKHAKVSASKAEMFFGSELYF